MMVSFLVLVGKILPDKKRCHRSGGYDCNDESGGSQHCKRIAVIENKFGEVDIDGHDSLVASHSSTNKDIVIVNNGCLCCTVHGEPVIMLLVLVKKRRDKFDHIVIETTSLAKYDPHLKEVKLRFMVNEAVEQVAYASRIIMNKIDLHINGMAQIKQAKYGVVDMDFVLGVGGYNLDRYLFVPFQKLEMASQITRDAVTNPTTTASQDIAMASACTI
ncbi:uncharacterized GTP-binding protein YjiA-like protein [Tanacetum coccineum]